MVLEGFEIPSWMGWLSGIFFYRVPWGLPVYKSWRESFVIYHFAIATFANLLWVDYIIHYSETFASDSVLRVVITKIFTYMAVLLFFYLRVCFFLKAKGIATFLSRLETHPAFSESAPSRKKALTLRDKFVIWTAFVMHSVAAAAFSAAVGSQRKREHSWFSILSKFQYTAVFFFFGTFPLSAGDYLALAYTLVTTKHLLCIYDDFCDYFEFVIKIENGDIPQLVFEPPPQEFKNAVFDNSLLTKELRGHGQRSHTKIKTQKELMRETLFSQFQIVFNLFEAYDTFVGPFLLGLIVTLIMYFVQTINAILILELSPLFLAFDWLTLVYLVFQLVLILFNLGHFAHKKIRYRKMRLQRMLATTPNTLDKIPLSELASIVNSWKWHMSAWGFFTIDRSLMPGVLSIMMSYVVILFQIQLNTVGNDKMSFRS